MPITIKRIAELAGVSRGTVDRALHGRTGVNPEVARRIHEIAFAYGYRPNRAARALATSRKNNAIGVLVNSEGNVFFDEVLRGVDGFSMEMADYGVRVVLRTMGGYDVERQIALIDELMREGIDALMLTPINDERVSLKLLGIIEQGFPVVTCNTDIEMENARLCYVGCDYEKSGRMAGGVLGLMTGGNANVALVTGSRKILGHNLREKGFDAAIAEDFSNVNLVTVVENNDDEEISRRVVRQALADYPHIDALCFLASGLDGGMRAVIEAGRSDIRAIAFDWTPATLKYLALGKVLATICQQPYEQGYKAIKTLFDYLISGYKPQTPLLYTDLFIKVKQNI